MIRVASMQEPALVSALGYCGQYLCTILLFGFAKPITAYGFIGGDLKRVLLTEDMRDKRDKKKGEWP